LSELPDKNGTLLDAVTGANPTDLVIVVNPTTGKMSRLTRDQFVTSFLASDVESIAGTVATKPETPAGRKATQPWFDVKSYGATGNGTTDDTTAVQAAITAAAAASGRVAFPPGTYKLSSTLTSPGVVTLRGVGKGSVLRAATATFNLIELTASNDGSSIIDLTFQGAATDDTTTQFAISHPAPTTPSANNVTIRGCRFVPQPTATLALNDAIKVYQATDWDIGRHLRRPCVLFELANSRTRGSRQS
jgi:hypothetical protein